MGIKISAFPPAAALTGTELVPIVQDNVTVRTTATALKTTNATDLITGTVAIARLPVANSSFAGIIQIGTTAGTACEGNDGRLSDSRTPSGSAGGDLTGIFPNPTLTTSGVSALTYGDASHVGAFTVNAKGLITNATSPSIAISASQVTSGLAASATTDTTNATNISSGTLKAISVGYLKETTTVQASAAGVASPVVLSVTAQPTLYYTNAATGNWILNITGTGGGATLDSLMSVNQAVTVTFINTSGATPYYIPTASLQIDGSTSNRTVKWLNGLTFTGNASSTDVWTFTIIKTASNVFTVLGNLTKFA